MQSEAGEMQGDQTGRWRQQHEAVKGRLLRESKVEPSLSRVVITRY